ncbi:hypothetical protein Moror_5782, partial [Moniliophthora roreri MCA 2997]
MCAPSAYNDACSQFGDSCTSAVAGSFNQYCQFIDAEIDAYAANAYIGDILNITAQTGDPYTTTIHGNVNTYNDVQTRNGHRASAAYSDNAVHHQLLQIRPEAGPLTQKPNKDASYKDPSSPFSSQYNISYYVSSTFNTFRPSSAPPPASKPKIHTSLLSQHSYVFVPKIPYPDHKASFAPVTFAHAGASSPGVKTSTLATKVKGMDINSRITSAQIAYGQDDVLKAMYLGNPSHNYEQLVLTIVWPGYP